MTLTKLAIKCKIRILLKTYSMSMERNESEPLMPKSTGGSLKNLILGGALMWAGGLYEKDAERPETSQTSQTCGSDLSSAVKSIQEALQAQADRTWGNGVDHCDLKPFQTENVRGGIAWLMPTDMNFTAERLSCDHTAEGIRRCTWELALDGVDRKFWADCY